MEYNRSQQVTGGVEIVTVHFGLAIVNAHPTKAER